MCVNFVNCCFNAHRGQIAFHDCEFVNCEIIEADVTLKGGEFTDGELKDIRGSIQTCIRHTTVKGNILNTEFINAEFEFVRFVHVSLDECELRSCRFENSEFDSGTVFKRTQFHEVSVDRILLESLGPTRGGITDTDLRRMTVSDSIARLRMSVGGVMFLLHTVALIFFLAPYASFITLKWIQTATTSTIGRSETMASALLRYWFNGGLNMNVWDFNWYTAPTSLLFLGLQPIRITLMVKGKSLEHSKQIKGIWPAFNDDAKIRYWAKLPWVGEFATWKRFEKIMKWGTVAALVFGTVHILSFCRTQVPIGGWFQ